MITLKEGDKAPAFRGVDQDGQPVSLKEYRGKKMILFFYPEADSPTCTVESCNLRDNYTKLTRAGFEVIGVSPDSPQRQHKFQQKYKLPYRLVADEENRITMAYGTRDWKKMFGHEYMGILRTTFVIDEKGIIRKIFLRPRSKMHAEEILAAMQA